MVLCALGSRARERVFRHPQLANLRDVELLPPVGCAALTVAAELKAQQPLDAMPDPIVVRLGQPGSSGPVDEFHEALVSDGAQEIGVQRGTQPSQGTSTRNRHLRVPCTAQEAQLLGPLQDLLVGARG